MSAASKILKPAGSAAADATELQVAQAIVDIENKVVDLKKDLKVFRLTGAKEVCIFFGFLQFMSKLG